MTRLVNTSHDEYLEHTPESSRERLQELLALISVLAPDAEPVISYQMPAFRLNKRILVYAAAYTSHIGFYPADSALLDEWAEKLAGLRVSKGTIHLPLSGPWPKKLIAALIEERVHRLVSS